jgi:hypothetical protein
MQKRVLIYFVFTILLTFGVYARGVLEPVNVLDRYMAERNNIGFLDKNNVWTGNNTFLNVTYLNQNTVIRNITYNVSNLDFLYTNKKGSDLTGLDGAFNRQITADPEMITVDNFFLHPALDYTQSAGTVTFLNPIWNTQDITMIDTELAIAALNYLGSSLSGTTGTTGRKLNVNNVLFVVVDNYQLQKDIDFSATTTQITFLNKIWNDQRITVWQK